MPLDMSQVAALGADLKGASRGIKKEASKTVRESAKAVERGAKARAPKDTGTLAAEIYSATRGSSAQITAPTRYAQFNEYGTSRMAPQPFMIPALEAEAPQFTKKLEDAAANAVTGAIGG